MGGKAASLGELIGAGFPIPSGFVVTTAAYAAYLKSSDPGPVRSLVESRAEAEARLTAGELRRLQSAVGRVRAGILIREESAFLVDRMTAVLRMIALRLGAALVDRSVLERADDVFPLFLDELALVNDLSDLGTTVARRRTAFARLETAYREGVPWPVAIGAVPSPEEDERVSPDGAATLTGVPASRGTYVGTARIVTSLAEFGHLARGDVLVAVSTPPSWTPLFQIAGAVVTQIGSPTSHAAIVAREYCVPAVVALDRITARLVDGQRVRVDGTRGTVTIVD